MSQLSAIAETTSGMSEMDAWTASWLRTTCSSESEGQQSSRRKTWRRAFTWKNSGM